MLHRKDEVQHKHRMFVQETAAQVPKEDKSEFFFMMCTH